MNQHWLRDFAAISAFGEGQSVGPPGAAGILLIFWEQPFLRLAGGGGRRVAVTRTKGKSFFRSGPAGSWIP
ncbi:MAG: hypothetical protein DMF49_11055 [Acidobacteria bacterium]|nr:MAG: hypothetical protein DMF49_11055 [Acidobacteriota bacterium]